MQNKELTQILNVLFDDVSQEPDLNIVSHIVVGSRRPIALMQEVVHVLWLALERPQEFDKVVGELE